MLIRVGTLFKRYMNQWTLIACLAWAKIVFQSKNGQENQTLGFNTEHIPKNGMFDDLTDIELCIPLEWGSNCATF